MLRNCLAYYHRSRTHLALEKDAPELRAIMSQGARGNFIEQLAGWFTDTTTWPRDRSFDVFCRWFDFQHHSMLVDLCDEPLIRESDY